MARASLCTQAEVGMEVLRAAPDLYLLLSPDLRIVEASDACLRATMTTRAEIAGLGMFEAFPDDPGDADAARPDDPSEHATSPRAPAPDPGARVGAGHAHHALTPGVPHPASVARRGSR